MLVSSLFIENKIIIVCLTAHLSILVSDGGSRQSSALEVNEAVVNES